jgi:hypothetical protein
MKPNKNMFAETCLKIELDKEGREDNANKKLIRVLSVTCLGATELMSGRRREAGTGKQLHMDEQTVKQQQLINGDGEELCVWSFVSKDIPLCLMKLTQTRKQTLLGTVTEFSFLW